LALKDYSNGTNLMGTLSIPNDFIFRDIVIHAQE